MLGISHPVCSVSFACRSIMGEPEDGSLSGIFEPPLRTAANNIKELIMKGYKIRWKKSFKEQIKKARINI